MSPIRKSAAGKPAAERARKTNTQTEPDASPNLSPANLGPAVIVTDTSGAALIERVARAVERELTQIETIVGASASPSERTETEKRARTLASLARTLGELTRLRAKEQKVKPDDDDVPRDLDAFRRELSHRLEKMVRGREALSSGGDE